MIQSSPYEVSDPEPMIPNAANLGLLYHVFLFVTDILQQACVKFFCLVFRPVWSFSARYAMLSGS